jgi:hypothetical protein
MLWLNYGWAIFSTAFQEATLKVYRTVLYFLLGTQLSFAEAKRLGHVWEDGITRMILK